MREITYGTYPCRAPAPAVSGVGPLRAAAVYAPRAAAAAAAAAATRFRVSAAPLRAAAETVQVYS